jgi:glucose/mannose-6-phosphate isomerase
MKALISGFAGQLEEAIRIGKNAKLTRMGPALHNVLVCGLGGSGIGGSIVSELVVDEAKAPINVSKGYFIPAYVNENTLVIISSYSGDTEETLNALELAMQKGAKVVCITSGGKIAAIAKQKNLDHIIVPGGMPPRACLGYSLTQLFFVLGFFGVTGSDHVAELENAVRLLKTEEDDIRSKAQKAADSLAGKTPVIYATTYNEGLAIRLRQQINENSKMLCWHHVFPELNHNELVGWTQKHDELAIVILRDPGEYKRNDSRIEISKKVFVKYTSNITELYSKGNSRIEKAIYLIHLGDWISWFLAEKRGVDAVEVSVINHLKSELSKI